MVKRSIRGALLGLGVAAVVVTGVAVVGSSAIAAERPAPAPAQAERTAAAGRDGSRVEARLTGFAEVAPKLTDGTGTFTATLAGDRINYRLTYSGLSAPATVAHVHFAQRGVNGGVMAFLCGGGGKPACPAGGGTVTGSITAADIQAISTPGATDQGVAAGDLAGALRVLRSGDAYVNVHSSRYAAGEIRGQVRGQD
jgi:hypothetical protein